MSIKSSKLHSCNVQLRSGLNDIEQFSQYWFFEANGLSCGSIDYSMYLSLDAIIVTGFFRKDFFERYHWNFLTGN